ncbi:hypothetical protein TNCV_1294451 [Trichonephila clavipes]|nr:hypothetical protein TNCV_1294451 [Trichonephila clavipes]
MRVRKALGDIKNGHEGNRSSEQANGNSSRDPDAVTRPENIDSLPPNVHCASIRSLQKLIRYAETRIRYQQELIDIETFDQRDTDAAQLQSYIHAKGATELDCNLKLGELKLLFPCPVKNCNHNTTNGLNATRHKKRAAESCILPASFNPYSKETNSTSKKTKTNDKDTCNNTAEINNRKELPENTIPVNNPFSVLTIDDDDMEVAGSAENNNIAQPKVKPIMLKFRDSCSGRHQRMTSTASWSDRTMPSSDVGTATAGAGAISPSRLSFDDSFIVEHSDLFRETIIARNVYAAWARKLTTAKPNDPDLQNIHMEVAKSGEIVSSHLAKLDVPLFKIPASEKKLDRIILREKNKTIVSPKKQEEKRPAAAPPPPLPLPARVEKERREPSTPTASLPKQLVRKVRSPRSTPPPSPTLSSAPIMEIKG